MKSNLSLTTPWKINMVQLQITHLEWQMVFQTSVIMFHVNLQGCSMDGFKLFGNPEAMSALSSISNSSRNLSTQAV